MMSGHVAVWWQMSLMRKMSDGKNVVNDMNLMKMSGAHIGMKSATTFQDVFVLINKAE